MRTRNGGQRSEVGSRKAVLAALMAVALAGFAGQSSAQMVVDYNFTTNATVPDGSGQYTDTHTLGGLASYTNITTTLSLTTQNVGDPMYLGDLFSSLTLGTGGGARAAVLLNRPGVDNTDAFGSGLSSLNVTLDDSASHTNIWATGATSGTFNSDGRLGVNPYAAGVAFNAADRTSPTNGTLSALNGSSLSTNDTFTMLVADTSGGATATLSNWGMSMTGTAAASGTMSAGATGTMVIRDTGSGATNNVGAAVVTTQNGGGALVVNIAGTMNMSGGISGSSGLTKSGTGSLTLSGTGSYTGATTISAGTLLVNGNQSSATGAVSVSGTLGGIGTIGGATTVNSGGIITGATNGTIGTLSFNDKNLTIGGSGTYVVDLGGTTSDLLALGSGILNLTASGDILSFNVLSTLTGSSYTLATYGSLASSAQFDTVTDLPTGYTLVYNATELDLVITAIPEPSTWFAAALAAAVIGYQVVVRRKASKKLAIA